ncbi:TRAP transporter substrate-binding protein DctP [Radicibacter daui]|uniref:TRAP transporter substrate-binding protein DctP n=1 Tax=Radicibacter daui TaxID=3064829 RepID=UPI004046CE3E
MRVTKKFRLALLWASLLPSAASAETILRYSDHEPLDGMRTRFIKDVFFPAIERESGGRLKVEDHWGGELAAAYDALGAVRDGKVTDMATAVPEYTARELPLHQVFKSFPVGPQGAEQVALFRRIYEEIPEFSEELAKNNLVEVFLGTGFPVAFYSIDPMKSLKELDGSRWRSASFWHLDYLRNVGATPVQMHWGAEVYDALKERTLDGIMVNIDSGYNLKVYENAPYVLVSRSLWLGHLYPLVMNRDAWNGLADEDRAAIRRAAEAAYRTLGTAMDHSFDVQLAELRVAGAAVGLLTGAEVQNFAEATRYKEVQADWVAKQEEAGVKSAGSVMEKVRTLLNQALTNEGGQTTQ